MLPWLPGLETPPRFTLELAPADWVGLGFLAVCAGLGALCGLWWQIFRIVGFGLAFGSAYALAPLLARELLARLPMLGPMACEVLSFLVLFVCLARLLGLLGLLGQRALAGLKLGLLDRVAGLLAAALLALLIYAAAVASARHLGSEAWAKANLTGTRSERLADDFEQLFARTHQHWPTWRLWLAERLREGHEALGGPAPQAPADPREPGHPGGHAAPSGPPAGVVR